MRDQFVTTSSKLLDEHENVALVLADISAALFRDEGVFARHPQRVINVGIREQLLIGVAAGLALEGFRPIAHTYAPFLVERPFEQVKLDLSHQGVAAVLVSVGASSDAAASGRTHQAPGDVALLSTLPDWEIHVPGHAGEVAALLEDAVASQHNVYLRLGEASNERARLIAPRRMLVARHGGRQAPTVVAVGPMLDAVLEATAELDATVLYATTARPLDGATLRQAATGDEVILVEPYLAGTSLAALNAALSDRPRRFLALGVPAVEHRHYGTRREHDRAYGLDAAGLRCSIRDFLGAGSRLRREPAGSPQARAQGVRA